MFAQLVIVLRSGAWLNVFCISPLLFCFPSPLRLLYLFGGLRGCLKHYNIRKIYFGFFPPLSFSSFLLLHCFSFGRHTNQNTAAGMVGCICLILFSFSFFFSALRVPSPISHLLPPLSVTDIQADLSTLQPPIKGHAASLRGHQSSRPQIPVSST